MLVFWVLSPPPPSLVASHGVVGLAGIDAWPGRGIVLCRGLVAALMVLPEALVVGLQRCRKKLCAIPVPGETSTSPHPAMYNAPVPADLARHHERFRWVTIFCLTSPSSVSMTMRYPW